jgi:hypothetical protein
MEKGLMCSKHSQPLGYLCKKCDIFVCGECIEEHSDQGHGVMSVLKYANTIVVPEVNSQLETLAKDKGAEGTVKEAKTLLELLKTAIEKQQAYLQETTAAIPILASMCETQSPIKMISDVKARLEAVLKAGDTSKLISLITSYKKGEFNVGVRDEDHVQLLSIIAKHQALLESWKIADAFYADLVNLTARLSLTSKKIPLATSGFESLIVTTEADRQQLLQWVSESLPGRVTYDLLWRGSRDGYTVATFQARCTNKGPTLSIIKSSHGKVCGGYTALPWKKIKEWGSDPTAFTFSLTHHTKHAKQKDLSRSIYCYPTHGPTFGGAGTGFDLKIEGECNVSNESCSYGTFTYELPPGADPSTYLAGSEYFNVAEIEIFAVIKA